MTKYANSGMPIKVGHATIAQGPGGPAAMVPGQHHVRMNMYIAQASGGRFQVVKSLGAIDPHERAIDMRQLDVAVTV